MTSATREALFLPPVWVELPEKTRWERIKDEMVLWSFIALFFAAFLCYMVLAIIPLLFRRPLRNPYQRG